MVSMLRWGQARTFEGGRRSRWGRRERRGLGAVGREGSLDYIIGGCERCGRRRGDGVGESSGLLMDGVGPHLRYSREASRQVPSPKRKLQARPSTSPAPSRPPNLLHWPDSAFIRISSNLTTVMCGLLGSLPPCPATVAFRQSTCVGARQSLWHVSNTWRRQRSDRRIRMRCLCPHAPAAMARPRDFYSNQWREATVEGLGNPFNKLFVSCASTSTGSFPI